MHGHGVLTRGTKKRKTKNQIKHTQLLGIVPGMVVYVLPFPWAKRETREGANREKLAVKKIINKEIFFTVYVPYKPWKIGVNREKIGTKPWKNRHQKSTIFSPLVFHRLRLLEKHINKIPRNYQGSSGTVPGQSREHLLQSHEILFMCQYYLRHSSGSLSSETGRIGFGEYGLKHRAQWVVLPSPSSGERTRSVPLSLLFVWQSKLIEFLAELTEFAPKLNEVQWVFFFETALSKQYSTPFLFPMNLNLFFSSFPQICLITFSSFFWTTVTQDPKTGAEKRKNVEKINTGT